MFLLLSVDIADAIISNFPNRGNSSKSMSIWSLLLPSALYLSALRSKYRISCVRSKEIAPFHCSIKFSGMRRNTLFFSRSFHEKQLASSRFPRSAWLIKESVANSLILFLRPRSKHASVSGFIEVTSPRIILIRISLLLDNSSHKSVVVYAAILHIVSEKLSPSW